MGVRSLFPATGIPGLVSVDGESGMGEGCWKAKCLENALHTVPLQKHIFLATVVGSLVKVSNC